MQEILKTNLLSIEKSRPGRRGVRVGTPQQTAAQYLPEKYLRKPRPNCRNSASLTPCGILRHYPKKITAWMPNFIRWALAR